MKKIPASAQELTPSGWLLDLLDLLKRLDDIDGINERDRRIIRRTVHSELIDAERRHEEYERLRNAGKKWSPEEEAALSAELKNRDVPTCYSEEELILEELAGKFGRPEKTVKKKAVQLGLGSHVDYWLHRKD